MTSVLFDLGFGFALGFSLTIPPGPMNAFMAFQSVRATRYGVAAGLGAMSADLVLGLLVYGLHSTFDLSTELRWVYLLGAGVLVYLGIGLLRKTDAAVPETTPGLRTYSKALALGITNPFQIVWWLTVGLAFAYLGGWVLFVGLFGAVAVWIVLFPWTIHLGAERRPGIAKAIIAVSAVLIFGFAAYFLFLAA